MAAEGQSMAIFTEERLSTMQRELEYQLASSRFFRNAGFRARLSAGDESLTIAVAEGTGQVSLTDSGSVDFSVSGPSEAWDGFFNGKGPISRASVIGMIFDNDISGGVLPAELTMGGDQVRMFANWPVVNRLLEAVATTHRGVA